jgi:DNA helicase-2/ATP-dependent DNA helicase PcrA
MSLNVNYRSHQDILDASFGMIEHNYTDDEHQDLRVKLSAEREQGRRPVDIVNGENTPAIEEYLVREVSAIIQAHPDASIAVIMRRNRELERVLRVFELAGVPVSSERSIDIFAHPVGAVFFDLLAYLADPTRIDALARTMISGLWNLTLDDAAAFVRDLKSGRAADLERRLPALRTIRNRMMHDGAIGFLVAAASESGFERLVVRHPAHTAVWRGIVALAESLARERHIEHPAALIEALLAYRTSAETKTVKVSVGAPESTVRAMTAHGSKGLEFDYVFVPYATEEAWVGRARGRSFVLPDEQSSGDDIRDARRLLYVALTRARKHAVILTAREESDGRTLTPLRFLEELDPDSVASVDIPRVHTAPLASPRAESGDDASVRALTDMAKQRLCASGLSVTALNHFIESPEKFLIESVLRVPQAPSVSAEKGSAMHAAMDRVWKTAQKTPKTIEKTIRTVVSEYLADSFLPIRDKETIEREVSDTAPVVAAALEAHVTTTGTVYTEYWVESAFAGSFDGNAVRFPLHGKLDAIIEEGDDVFVFDYKTTKSMSTAAIKGETKSSDGKYFRQLIFYALLMHEHPRWKGKRIHTSLVFLSPDKKGRCPTVTVPVTKEDIEGLRSDIQALIDYVWSGQLETALPDFPENG